MKLLLDTHAFLWWDSSPARLSATALAACHDPANTLLLSVASVWEMQIKLQLGKLTLTAPLDATIENQKRVNSLVVLPVTLEHVLALQALPPLHKDPFDRLLVAQANVEGATLVSNDPLLKGYAVSWLW